MMFRTLFGSILALLAIATGASAQDWPIRTIRAVVPFTAGSGSDIITRTIMEQLSKQLGQSIVVENRVGAGGTIGTAAVAKADPDGYTILSESSAHTSTPLIYKSLPYNVEDLATVAGVASMPQVLVISPSKGIKTVQELVAYAKANRGKVTYASGGVGSATQLSVEKFRLSAGFEGVHVPFKGGPEALTEVMTGRVDFYFVPALPALPLIRDGKLLALAVGSTKRSAVLPDVPTTIEAGYPDSDYAYWVGLFLPAKTPRPIVDKLNRETGKALQVREVQERLARSGAEPMPMSPEDFSALRKAELASNEKLIKALGLTRTQE
jgi:tripartite-type tricarboxylate transporter receptor subunit TctC